MRRLVLPVRRPVNGRAYLLLVALLVPAELAILPYSLSLSATEPPGLWNLMLGAGIDLLLLAALAAVGLLVASRIGLGMPFVESWMKREPLWERLPGVAGISILAGILLPLVLLLDSALAPLIEHTGVTGAESLSANVANPRAWQGFLAALSAGITEETMFRLFGLSLVAWLGSLLLRSRTGRPTPRLLWAANVLFALLFGLAHLPAASQAGIPLDAVAVARTLVVNGVGGIVFGWLYWSFGLESAILAHVSADAVVHGVVPLVIQQASITRSALVGVVAALVGAAVVLWSIRSVLCDRTRFAPSWDPSVPQTEAVPPDPAFPVGR